MNIRLTPALASPVYNEASGMTCARPRLLTALLLAAFCMLAAPPAAMADEQVDEPREQIGTNRADDLRGGAGADRLVGRRGNDELRGKGGDDELRGGRGNDLLRGGAGDDVLHGGRGNDVLRGGIGNDVLHGGRGGDRFAFALGARGRKVIADFGAGDTIALGADPEGGSWPAVAEIVAGAAVQDGRYTYTLRPGLTVETNAPLAVGDFVFLGDAALDTLHAVALPDRHTLDSWLTHNPDGSLTVPAGEHRDAGGLRFSCPADGGDCTLTVTSEDGAVAVSSTGGAATAGPLPAAAARLAGTPPPAPSAQTAPSTAAGATAHGIASAIVSLGDDALTDPFVSWPVSDRPLTLGVPYHVLPLSLHKLSKGILGGELDNDDDPSTPTGFAAADAPPAISGWSGSARAWSRADGAGGTTVDTVTLYAKADSGESYLAFGYWARVPGSGAAGIGTFGNDPTHHSIHKTKRNPLSLNAAWPRGANVFAAGRHHYWPGGWSQLDALAGAATYAGAAAGLYSERAAGARDGASGAFTADAALTADFDARYVRLSGRIDNFRDASGAPLGDWTARLANDSGGLTGGGFNGGGFAVSGNVAGAADGRGWSGGWVAQFFRRSAADPQTAHPTAVGGAFQAHRGTPAMAASDDAGFVGVIGAFGAGKQ